MKDDVTTKAERQAALANTDVRLEKVEGLRTAIAEGSYTVSAEALAEKMIEHMRRKDAK